MKLYLFITTAFIFLQTQDDLLLGRWLMVANRNRAVEDHIEIFFKKDHSFELWRYETVKKGNWRIYQGINTLELYFFNDRPVEMKDFSVIKDSLYFSEGEDNMVFVRVK